LFFTVLTSLRFSFLLVTILCVFDCFQFSAILHVLRYDFLQQFCRKLLGYALGRGVILSDRQLLEEMVVMLNENDGPASAAILAIVASKQFQTIRGSEWGK